MHIGRSLVSGSSGSVVIWTPWMPRLADQARFTYEEIVLDGFGGATPTFTVQIHTKSSNDDTRDGTASSASFSNVSGTNFYTATADDLKDLYRFKLTLSGDSVLVYRFLEPTWFNTAKA